jgi:hypothetical protein
MTGKDRERMNHAARCIIYAGLFYAAVYAVLMTGEL